MSVEANKATFRAHLMAMEERRLETLDAHPALADSKAFFEQLFSAFPDSQATVHELIGEGDWVAYRMMHRGTHQGEFMGMPATGRQAEWEVIGTMRIVDGKIVENHAQADVLGMTQQLGVAPPVAAASQAGLGQRMYAVIGVWRSASHHLEEQLRVLRERIVPGVSRSPGFVAGYWTHDRSSGKDHTTIVFEGEEAALAFKSAVGGNSRNQAAHGMEIELLVVVEVLASTSRDA